MLSWTAPPLPPLPGRGPDVRVHDTASAALRTVGQGRDPRTQIGMYVCGITPYDAAHLGHAATYVAFDVLHRALLDAGRPVQYVQNITDVDDPLLERAAVTGEDWTDLAARQTALFTEQMSALSVLPPQVFLGVTEVIKPIAALVVRLLDSGAAYPVDGDGTGADVYFDVTADPRFGAVSHLAPAAMADLFARRGGDPDRPGKRGVLDPLLWRAARPGEPSWEVDGLPAGRPGWHVECVAIVLIHLGMGFDVQGGGSDLVFPHHEMGASHARVVTGGPSYARAYVHAGLVGLDGEKMSKSRGNLVFVHDVLAAGVSPAALRLALLAHHYRHDWEWTTAGVEAAAARADRWRAALQRPSGPDAHATLARIRDAVTTDLDTPAALAAVDDWAAHQLGSGGPDPDGPATVRAAVDRLLGIRL